MHTYWGICALNTPGGENETSLGREWTLERRKDQLSFRAVNWDLGEDWPNSGEALKALAGVRASAAPRPAENA